MYSNRNIFISFFASAIITTAPALAQNDNPGTTTAPANQTAHESDPYLLDVCVVSGRKLGAMGDQIVKVYGGREIRFCCNGCIKKFEADPATYWKKVDELIIKRQMPFYPIDTCIVSKKELGGAMGPPIDFVYNNRLIRFCCKGCKRHFLDDSEAFLNKLDEAVIASQREKYPLQTCPVSGGALDSMGEPVEMVYGNRLVKLCCKGCIKKFKKNPTTFVAAIDNAWKEYRTTDAANHVSASDDNSSVSDEHRR